MPLITTKSMLLHAQKNGYAVVACNVENMEMAQAVITAAEQSSSPIIIQTTPGTLSYANVEVYAKMITALAESTSVPVALHLDHGNSFELVMRAIMAGYSSIMIDGSGLSFEDNIALTKKVVDVASAVDIPVEAELGVLGGKEDNLEKSAGDYTDPHMAEEFVTATGASSLAIAIGTAHGLYKKKPELNMELLEKIRLKVDVPLVLHGASGIDMQDIRDAVKKGICKVNIATELRACYMSAARTYLSENEEQIDPKKMGIFIKNSITELVKTRIEVCGSKNRKLDY